MSGLVSSVSVRDAQVAVLNSLLALNTTPAGSSSSNTSSAVTATAASGVNGVIPTWKVMIMDKTAQDVVATSLRVQDLRDAGVTLHMSAIGCCAISSG